MLTSFAQSNSRQVGHIPTTHPPTHTHLEIHTHTYIRTNGSSSSATSSVSHPSLLMNQPLLTGPVFCLPSAGRGLVPLITLGAVEASFLVPALIDSFGGNKFIGSDRGAYVGFTLSYRILYTVYCKVFDDYTVVEYPAGERRAGWRELDLWLRVTLRGECAWASLGKGKWVVRESRGVRCGLKSHARIPWSEGGRGVGGEGYGESGHISWLSAEAEDEGD